MKVEGTRLQLIKKLNGRIVGFRGSHVAFCPTLFDALFLSGVELCVAIVQLNPVVPKHVLEAHSDVIGTPFEWAIRQGRGLVNIPARVGCGSWTFEI